MLGTTLFLFGSGYQMAKGHLDGPFDLTAETFSHLGGHLLHEALSPHGHSEEAASTFLRNQHLETLVAHVLKALVQDFARKRCDGLITNELNELAEDLPEIWTHYAKEGHLIVGSLSAQKAIPIIADILANERPTLKPDPTELTAFFKWIADQSNYRHLLDRPVLDALGIYLADELPGKLTHALAAESKTAAPAFRTVMLRLQSQVLQDIAALRKEMTQGFDKLSAKQDHQLQYLADLTRFQETMAATLGQWTAWFSQNSGPQQQNLGLDSEVLEVLKRETAQTSRRIDALGTDIEDLTHALGDIGDQLSTLIAQHDGSFARLWKTLESFKDEIKEHVTDEADRVIDNVHGVDHHLSLKLDHLAAGIGAPASGHHSWQDQLILYAKSIRHRYESLKLYGLLGRDDSDSPITLSGVFVEPDVESAVRRARSELEREISKRLGTARRWGRYGAPVDQHWSEQSQNEGTGIAGWRELIEDIYKVAKDFPWAYRRELATALDGIRTSLESGIKNSSSQDSLSSLQQQSEEWLQQVLAKFNLVPGKPDTFTLGLVLSALSVPTQRVHLLLGAPGHGKSSVLRLIVLDWIARLSDSLTTDQVSLSNQLVPLLIEVREVISSKALDHSPLPHEPQNALVRHLCRSGNANGHFHGPDFEAALRAGQIILLIDGIDEAFDQSDRGRIVQSVLDLAADYPKARIVASSRDQEFNEEPWLHWVGPDQDEGWCFHTIKPFDEPRIHAFLDHWQQIFMHSEHERLASKEQILASLSKSSDLRQLAGNPLCLSLMCLLPTLGSGLGTAYDLYYNAVNAFLAKWDNQRGLPYGDARLVNQWRDIAPNQRLDFLTRIARRMVAQGGGSLTNSIGLTDLLSEFKQHFANTRFVASDHETRDMLRLFSERNYLLTRLGEDQFGFIHRSFLEYFTAKGWFDEWENNRKMKPRECFDRFIAPRWKDETWQLSLQFFVAMLGPQAAPEVLQPLTKRSLMPWAVPLPVDLWGWTARYYRRMWACAESYVAAARYFEALGSAAQHAAAGTNLGENLVAWLAKPVPRSVRPYISLSHSVDGVAQAIASLAPDGELMVRLCESKGYNGWRHIGEASEQLLRHWKHMAVDEKNLDRLAKAIARSDTPFELRWLAFRFVDVKQGDPGLQNAVHGLADLQSLKELSLSGCTGLRSTEGLRDLPALKELDLQNCTGLVGEGALLALAALARLRDLYRSGCNGLRSTEGLRELPALKRLWLRNCTGLVGEGALQGLAGLRGLEFLDLSGCTGLRSTEGLKDLPALKELSLQNCTGLEGEDALQGLTGLRGLRDLSLSGCTGLTAEVVGRLRDQIGGRCMIYGP